VPVHGLVADQHLEPADRFHRPDWRSGAVGYLKSVRSPDRRRSRPPETVLLILAESVTSSDDDQAEDPPVGPAGVEQRSDPGVLEVGEAKATRLTRMPETPIHLPVSHR
jgi:hypothetical protein